MGMKKGLWNTVSCTALVKYLDLYFSRDPTLRIPADAEISIRKIIKKKKKVTNFVK